eukprot:UN02312
MFDLYNKIIASPNFKYPSRIETLLSDIALNEVSSLVDNGHRYAMEYAQSQLNHSNKLSEQMGGLSQVRFVNQLASDIPNNLDAIVDKLEQIHKILFSNGGLNRVMLVADEETWKSGKNRIIFG